MFMALCVVLGVFAGVSSGIFGIGGGILIVPALMIMFKFSQKTAQGTSLAALLAPVGILAVANYHRSGNLDVRAAVGIAAGYFGGAYLGSKFALSVSNDQLRQGFGVFMIVLGLAILLKWI